jgi:hypothetical protein
MADPSRDVILEAVHFLVEIGNPRHPRLSGMLSIRSYGVTPQRSNNLAAVSGILSRTIQTLKLC